LRIRFLLDENQSKQIKLATLYLNPTIDILYVGEHDTPPLGTLDSDILRYLEVSQRLLITDNRKSMPGHLKSHWVEGRHIWGLLWVRPKTPIGRLAQELMLAWETTEAEEWIDRLDWIPFQR